MRAVAVYPVRITARRHISSAAAELTAAPREIPFQAALQQPPIALCPTWIAAFARKK